MWDIRGMDTCYFICSSTVEVSHLPRYTVMQVGIPTVMSTSYYSTCVANATRILITNNSLRFLGMMTSGR